MKSNQNMDPDMSCQKALDMIANIGYLKAWCFVFCSRFKRIIETKHLQQVIHFKAI